MFNLLSIISMIVVGAIVGFVAGWLMRGRGFGFWLNALVGILGGFLGNLVLNIIGFSAHNFLASFIVDVLGALLLLWIFNKLRSK